MSPLPDPQSQIPAKPLPSTVADGFTFAAVGDLVGPSRPQMPHASKELSDVSALLTPPDATFANLEGSIFDIDSFSGARAAENGGGYPLSDPAVANDLRLLGIDMVSRANNHATDWGTDGMLETGRVLDGAGIVHAGSGRNRGAARAPAFLETARGRVALVSAASTFTPMSMAGVSDGRTAGRPGISTLRTNAITVVTEEEMTALRTIAARQGAFASLDSRARTRGERVVIGGETFEAGPTPGLYYEMNARDQSDLLRTLRGAKQKADLVVFALHAHETLTGDGCDHRPADFVQTLYHQAVDAGADVVVTTGPHIVRAVEIYRGKPIFYGLGSLFLEMGGSPAVDPDAADTMGLDAAALTQPEFISPLVRTFPGDWYDSIATVSEFRGGRVDKIHLHPLTLTRRDGYRLSGAPQPATPHDAARILERIAEDSKRYGTDVVIDDGVGIIQISTVD